MLFAGIAKWQRYMPPFYRSLLHVCLRFAMTTRVIFSVSLYALAQVWTSEGYRGQPADVWSCGVILYVRVHACTP